MVVSKEFFISNDISKKAFDAEPEDFYDEPGKSVKERSVDVYVTDGIEGLNIEKIKSENKWLRSVQPLDKDIENMAKQVPETGLEMTIIYLISISIVGLIVGSKKFN